MSKLEEEIKARTERFAAELADLIKKAALESVSQALAGDEAKAVRRGGGRRASGAPAKRAGGRKKVSASRARRKKGEKRTPEELEALTKALHSEVKKGGNRGIEAIAEAMGVSTKELALPVRKLVEEGKLKTKGQKRATKYFAK